MKGFLVIIVIINTVFFGATAFFSMQSYKLMEKGNTVTVKASLDTMNVRLKSINASLDDKLYGIMSSMPKR
ncbi:MAG: hypothetical protein WCK13_04150 [Ignavibacteriota bacterium]